MRPRADRTHARAAPAVWDAERLVQVEVAHVRADVAGATDADLRVHVRAVHVDLSAVLVNDAADVQNRPFINAVRRGIGDHQRGEVVLVGGGAGGEVGHVDVALRIAFDRHDLIPGHHRAGGIRAVCAGGDETDFAVSLPAAFVVAADGEEARVFHPATRALGWRLTAGRPVISPSHFFEFRARGCGSLPPARRARTGASVRTPATSRGTSPSWR